MSNEPRPETNNCARNIDQSNFEDFWKDDFEEFAWVTADFACKLERERDEAREQRDRLAEALRVATACPLTDIWFKQAIEALDALKPCD